jgi:hypothetical protein
VEWSGDPCRDEPDGEGVLDGGVHARATWRMRSRLVGRSVSDLGCTTSSISPPSTLARRHARRSGAGIGPDWTP